VHSAADGSDLESRGDAERAIDPPRSSSVVDVLFTLTTQSQAVSVLQLCLPPDFLRVRGGHDHRALQVGVLVMAMLRCALVSCAAETMMQEHWVS
jgi:hypothetical protein